MRIHSRPFLWYLLHHLRSQGVTDVVLATGHLGNMVADYAGDGVRWKLRVRSIREPEPLGTGGAVRLAADTMGLGDPLLIINGDTVFDGSIAQLLAFHDAKPHAQGSLALVRVPDPRRYGRVDLDPAAGTIREFVEKEAGWAGRAWINAGMYVLGPELVAGIDAGRTVSLERDILPAWVGRGLYGCPFPRARFLDFGTPEDHERASTMLPLFSGDPLVCK